jgi:hypothetical protein
MIIKKGQFIMRIFSLVLYLLSASTWSTTHLYGGESVVVGHYLENRANPALSSIVSSEDDFGLLLPYGVIYSDRHADFLKDVDALKQSDKVVTDIEDGLIYGAFSVNFVIPFDEWAVGMFNDISLLIEGQVTPDEHVRLRGVSEMNYGVSLSRRWSIKSGVFSVGGRLRSQNMEWMHFAMPVEDFLEEDIDDRRFRYEKSFINLDLGVYFQHKSWHFGLSVKDLLSKRGMVNTGNDPFYFAIAPQGKLGIAYKHEALDVFIDIESKPTSKRGKKQFYQSVGLFYKNSDIPIGLTYYHDQSELRDHLIKMTFQYAFFSQSSMQIGLLSGRHSGIGLMMQTGMRF